MSRGMEQWCASLPFERRVNRAIESVSLCDTVHYHQCSRRLMERLPMSTKSPFPRTTLITLGVANYLTTTRQAKLTRKSFDLLYYCFYSPSLARSFTTLRNGRLPKFELPFSNHIPFDHLQAFVQSQVGRNSYCDCPSRSNSKRDLSLPVKGMSIGVAYRTSNRNMPTREYEICRRLSACIIC